MHALPGPGLVDDVERLRARVAATCPEDPAPVAFDWHAVTHAEAPATWQLLAVLRQWGLDAAEDPATRTFLWAAYLSTVAVRWNRSASSARYHARKAHHAIGDMARQVHPFYVLLGEAAWADLLAAISERFGELWPAGIERPLALPAASGPRPSPAPGERGTPGRGRRPEPR